MPITRKKKTSDAVTMSNLAAAPVQVTPPANVKEQEFSRTKQIGAGLVRGVTGLGGSFVSTEPGLGSAVGFGIGGLGDLIAQAIEEGDPNPLHQLDAASLKRAGVEGLMAATPAKWLMAPGKVVKTALKSGAISGAGEYAREKARNEDANPKKILGSAAFGAATGGLLSKLIPSAPGAAAVKAPVKVQTVDDLINDPAGDVGAFAKALPGIMHREGWKGDLDKILSEASRLEGLGKPEHAQAVREVGLATGYWDPKTVASEIARLDALGDSEGAQALRLAAAKTRRGTQAVSEKAAKITREKAKATEIANAKAKKLELAKARKEELEKTGKVTPSASTKVSEVDPDTGETITFTENIKARKGKKGAAPIETSGPNGPRIPTAPAGKPGIWQVIDANTGDVRFEGKTEQEIADYINNPARLSLAEHEMTPEIRVVPPSDFKPAAAPVRTSPKLPKVQVMTGERVTELTGKTPEEAVDAGLVTPTTTGKMTGFIAQGDLTARPTGPVETPSVLPVEPVAPDVQAARNAQAKAEAAAEGPGIPRAVIDAGPPVGARSAAPVIDLAPAGPAPADMPLKKALTYYKRISPVEDLKFLLRNQKDLPEELTTKITKLLQSKKLNKNQISDIFNEVKAAGVARDKAAGVPAIGTKAWHEAQDAAKLANEVPTEDVIPEVPVAPVEEVPSVTPEVPVGISPESIEKLKALGWDDEAISRMNQSAADSLVAEGVKTSMPARPVPVGSGTPRGVEVPPVEASGKPTLPTVGKSGKVDYRQVLTDQEAQEVYERITRERYAEAGAPDAAEELIAATKAYRTAKAAGSGEANDLGKQVGWVIPSRHISEGKVPAGFAKQVSDEVKVALQTAGENKLASSIKIGDSPLPESPTVAGESLPETGSGLSDSEQLPIVGPETDVTNMPKEPNTLVTGDMLPAHLEKRVRELMDGVDSGNIPPEMATRMRTKLNDEIKKYFESRGNNGPTLGSGFGALQMFKDNPQMALKASMIAGGALIGGATDPLGDPILSMALGGLAGMTGAKGLELLQKAHINPADVPEFGDAMKTGKGFTEAVSGIIHLVPHFQRANYLWSMEGLGANAVAGPYGSGFFGALTKGLSGDKRGWAALREFAPWNAASWVKEYKASYAEAIDLIQRVEAGDPLARAEVGGATVHKLLSGSSNTQAGMRAYLGFPAWTMAAGDLATRKILMRAGFTEAEAREITLTAEPMLPSFQKLMNLRRGKPAPLLETMFPFVRTPLNILEQGLMRTPGIGLAVHKAVERQGKVPVAMAEKIAQQGLGTIIASSAYVIGLMAPKEYAPTLRRYLSNGAGQYSALASIGFAVGQGAQRTGDGPISGALSPEAIRQLGYSFPVPAVEPITNWLTMAGQLYNGRPVNFPPGLVPQQKLDVDRYTKEPETPTSGLGLQGIGGIRRKARK